MKYVKKLLLELTTILLVFIVPFCRSEIPTEELNSLVDIYFSTDGANWSSQTVKKK